ncbi:MAG: hypothetical protein INR69_15110 [Mucilaginibacter polytrichastri]|nr:hypothetical protein [Mucilaginibacter polytrichastri]
MDPAEIKYLQKHWQGRTLRKGAWMKSNLSGKVFTLITIEIDACETGWYPVRFEILEYLSGEPNEVRPADLFRWLDTNQMTILKQVNS